MGAGRDHPRGQDARRAVERRERLVELGHVAADRGLALDQVDREARVGDLERGRDAGDAAADDQGGRVDRHPDRLERRLLADAEDTAGDDRLGLGGRGVMVGVDPRDLLADRHQLAQVGVEPGPFAGAAEGLLVHVRRAGRHHDAVEAELADVVLDQLLAEARAHERVVAGDDDALGAELLGGVVTDRGDIDHAGDVRAAVADVHADPLLRFGAHRSGSSSTRGIGRPAGFLARRAGAAPRGRSSAGGGTSTPMRARAPGRRRSRTRSPAPGARAEGEADELGEEQDRHVVLRVEVAVHLALVRVDVHLAHRADGHQQVGTGRSAASTRRRISSHARRPG